jgi:hypothetical protein
MAYLMSGRALTWATVVWEQKSTVCLSLEEFVVEVRKVFESPLSRREAALKLLKIPVMLQTMQWIFALWPLSALNPESLFDVPSWIIGGG